jgi:hypothetical protein
MGDVNEIKPTSRHLHLHPPRPLLAVGRLVGANSDDVCLIVDILATGALVQTRQPLRRDGRVTLELGEHMRLPSRVGRVTPEDVALEFDRPLTPEQLIEVMARGTPETPAEAASGEATACRRQSPRLRRCAAAELLHRGRLLDGDLVDISTGGACIDLADPTVMRRGERLEVQIAGVTERDAAVRWASASRIGVAFTFPLSLWKLDKWLLAEMAKCSVCEASACSAPAFNQALARRRA